MSKRLVRYPARCRPAPLRAFAALFVGLLLASGQAAAATLPSGFGETTLGGTTGAPVAVDWAPDGRMFIAHKGGLVQVRKTDGNVSTLLDLSAKVNSHGDRGLLGIAVDRDFETNHYLYLLYVRELNPLAPDSSDPMTSRLTRIQVMANSTVEDPSDPETVILGTETDQPCAAPDNGLDCIPADFYWHVIGTVRSDPADGTLWVGTGDSHAPIVDNNSYRPYEPSSYAGKIIHVDRNGNGLPGHPFCSSDTDLSHVCTKIYASGFRNPFRFTLRSDDGPAVGDVGQADSEELNLTGPGENYGWPCYEGPAKNDLYQSETRCLAEYAKEGTAAAAVPPTWSYPTSGGGAIVAGPVYEGGNYPSAYDGKLFIADYVGGWIKVLTIDSDEEVVAEEPFATDTGPIVDLESMPNGDIAYVNIGLGSSPAVRRLTYAGGNLPPFPVAAASPTAGLAPLSVQFNGSGSSDPEDDDLTYLWDFGDGSPTSTAANPTHVYADVGVYTARLTIDDGFDRFPNDTVTVDVGENRAPVPAIEAPLDESSYRGGTAVALEGSATDDGPSSAIELSWHVILHHNTHLHEVANLAGDSASFVPYVDHGADSYYDVSLTASDGEGRSATKTVQIRPETMALTLASSPQGARILFAGEGPFTTPSERTTAIGSQAMIEAPESFVRGGHVYLFENWSDGGGRKHLLSVPAADTTLLAVYRRQSPPETTMTAGPSGPTPHATASFSFGSDDSGARFECALDWESFGICSSPFRASALGEGAHTFAVRATDPYVGTPDATPAVRSFVVDTRAPRTRIVSGPGRTLDRTPTFRFRSNEARSRFRCRIDSGRWIRCGSPKTLRRLAFGAHLFRVAATDLVGNRGAVARRGFLVIRDLRRPRD